jgi:hypothetical protein
MGFPLVLRCAAKTNNTNTNTNTNDPTKMSSEYDSCGVLIGHQSNCQGVCCVPDVKHNLSLLFGQQAAEDYTRLLEGETWWQIYGEDMIAIEERLAAEYAATRTERDAADAAAIEAFERKNKADRVAIREGASRNKHGVVEIRRVAQPCKFLYDCQGSPAKPTTRHITTECWSHAKGVCPWAHPGDANWVEQWLTDRLFRPESNERFAFAAAKPKRK